MDKTIRYYIDAKKISLDELQKRIEETDLVPSRRLLLEGIHENFSLLKENGYVSLADLRKEIGNSRNISKVAQKTGISGEYLNILRREIESYFPKAFPINSFNWLPEKDLEKLENQGYKNTVLLFDALNSSPKKEEILTELNISIQVIHELNNLIDLTRIQWVSPMTAKMLISAGYRDVKSVAKANSEKLYEELDKVNRENHFFKGKIGLRDIKRLIKSASYIS